MIQLSLLVCLPACLPAVGDVAFRILRAIRRAELEAAARGGGAGGGKTPGSVVVFDINAQMLEEGRKKALEADDLKGGEQQNGRGASYPASPLPPCPTPALRL